MAESIHVGIIGGGLAGMAAAATLAEKGVKSTIIEASPRLGGRARNVAVEFNSQVVQLDNGQHIMLGAYHETLKLISLIGANHSQAFMRLPLKLETVGINKSSSLHLSTPRFIPFPLNQLIGFICCKGLSISERFSVIRMIARLKQISFHLSEDMPLLAYLTQQKQSHHTVTQLWEPICLAALNTPIASASSKVFLNVLKDCFDGQKHDSDLLLPKLGLSELFAQPLTQYIQARGSNIITGERVKSIDETEDGYTVTSQKKQLSFSHIIIAISSHRLKDIAAGLPKLAGPIAATKQYRYQPIYTIYLQYPTETKLHSPMIGLQGGLSQWVFDRGIMCGQHGLLAVIISAEGEHQQLEQDVLASKVAQELHIAFPKLPKPLWHQVIAEKRATFSCDANLTRPAHITRQTNVYLAGDYTYEDYPATIEGAIRSGINAARAIH